MPQEVVSADGQPVRSSKVDKLVSAVEVEVSSRGLSGIPLHAILRRDSPKVSNYGIGILAITDINRVGDGAEVELALSLEEFVDAG